MSLSIIIVNYRAADHICNCLQSAAAFDWFRRFEWIVVDNDSGDDSRERILSRYPFVRWIDMGYNAGFARANNAGMKTATGNMLLLLNPDTLCIDDSVAACFQRLQQSSCVAAGVQLLNRNREPEISGSKFVKGGMNHLLPIPYWGGLIRRLAYTLKTPAPHVKKAAAVQEVDWISGAFLMVKRSAVEQAGMMDEDFFLYGEEVEWCSRLRKTGSLCIFGDLSIIHLEGAAIDERLQVNEKGYYNLYDRKGLQLMVSNHLRVRKQYGAGWYLFLLLNYSWGVLFYAVCSTVHRLLLLQNPLPHWKKVMQFGRNVCRLWTLMPRMLANRPYFYKMF